MINRGNYRRNLFGEDGSGEAFERVLGEAAQRFGWRVHAYVIMRNHFHLAVELTEPNLSDGMKWLQGTWIRRHNAFRRLIGRPFQGRFKGLLVEPGHAFGQVCHYIHLNPVRAGVVPATQANGYALSSLPKFPLGRKRPQWLEPATVLGQAGGLADTKAGWGRYLRYLEYLATDETAKRELVARRLSRGWCLGTVQFKKDQQREAARRGADLERVRFAGLEGTEVRQVRVALWEERLEKLAGAAGVDLGKLSARKSHPDKVLLASAMKQSTSVPNGWLAQRLGMGQPASASQFVRRWMLDDGRRALVERLLSRVKA
ncbi:transposase [Congregicoccus parvus]|uniref:transposase n=1 Tax=Congregicoccus parvus TaxID=3081749 RepID=UPI003FA5B84E